MPRRSPKPSGRAERLVKRAAIYCRVSTEDQAGNDRVSLSEQEADCRLYCERQGYQVVDVFTDAGYSGATADRPSYQRMLAAVRTRAVDVVVVWKLDRLARAYGPLEQLRDEFRPAEANIEGSREHVDSHAIELFIWVAKEEHSRIIERMLMGR